MKTKNAKQTLLGNSQAIISSNVGRNLYLLSGDTLLPLAPEYFNSHTIAEKNFRSEKELEELVLKNSKTLFGQHTFIVQIPQKKKALFKNDVVPKSFLLDISDITKPRFYILDTLLGNSSFDFVFPRVIKFFSYFHHPETRENLAALLGRNKELKKILQARMQNEEIPAYLTSATGNRPFILLVVDREVKDVPDILDTYFASWQLVKPLMLKKYSSKGKTFCSVSPPFSEIQAKEKKKRDGIPMTEESHLEKSSDEVKEIYNKVKADLLKIDNQLQFNPQKYYISLRKNRNLAFFHFSRKKISIVVMTADKDARKIIKHHEVKTLAETVQKFWNGSSCTIVIADAKHLNEVTGLLKKLIAE